MNKIEVKNRQCTSPSISNVIWILSSDTICQLNSNCQIVRRQSCIVKKNNRRENEGTQSVGCIQVRVAEVGSLSAKTKKAIKFFVRPVFDIFATNASFLRAIANLQILFSTIYNIYHEIVQFLPKKHCF